MSTVKIPRDREGTDGTGDFQLSLLILKKPAAENVSSVRHIRRPGLRPEGPVLPLAPQGAELTKGYLECDHGRETVDCHSIRARF